MYKNYYDAIGWETYPQWAKSRITYQEDVNIINMLIKENQNWIDYYTIRGNTLNTVLHKERIELLKKNLIDLEKNLKII